MRESQVAKENLFDVLRKFGAFLLVAVLLFSMSCLFRAQAKRVNADKEMDALPVPKPTLAIRSFEEIKTETPQGTVLGRTDPVGTEYFSDAVFAGDSLTIGWASYGMADGFEVIAKLGLSPVEASVMTIPAYTTPDGEELLLADAIHYIGARKAYVMLGSNGLNYASPEDLIAGYSKFVDDLILKNPDTYIILQSIPPVSAKAAASKWDGRYVKENVDHYNNLIRDLAIEKGVNFLDVYSAFAGEDGYMPEDLLGGADGMHINKDGYTVWLDYARTHVIKGDAAVVMNEEGLLTPMRSEEEIEE